jgi:hypothetical protein
MAEWPRCDEVLQVMAQMEGGTRTPWFVDGDAFTVDIQPNGMQFNPSHVGPEDAAYWNQPQGRFSLSEVATLLRQWCDYLAADAQP